MKYNNLQETACYLFQSLAVIGAVNEDDMRAVREIPALIKRLSETAEQVYLAICDLNTETN